jgi:hypothetical protein
MVVGFEHEIEVYAVRLCVTMHYKCSGNFTHGYDCIRFTKCFQGNWGALKRIDRVYLFCVQFYFARCISCSYVDILGEIGRFTAANEINKVLRVGK